MQNVIKAQWSALTIGVGYMLIASIWLLLMRWVIPMVITDSSWAAIISSAGEGAGYLVSAGFIVWLIRHAQQTHSHARATIEQCLTSIDEIAIICDSSSAIIYVSPSVQTITGYTPAAIQHSGLCYVHPEDIDTVQATLNAACRGQSGRAAIRIIHASGSDQVLQMVCGPYMRGEQVIGAWCLQHDITTEQRNASDLRQARDLLQHTNRLAMVGQFAAELVHEINHPLTTIQLGAELMLAESDSETTRNEARMLLSEARRATQLIRQVRSMSQKWSGERVPISLNEVVSHFFDIQNYILRSRQVKIDLQLDPHIPPVLADPLQIEQVLRNLFSNAEHALLQSNYRVPGRQPRIIIATLMSAGETPGSVVVTMRVQDNGPGIPVEMQQRIFDPFFTTKHDHNGTGLGLPITRDIIQQHNGELRLTSSHANGTTIDVRLPGIPTIGPRSSAGNSLAAPTYRAQAPIKLASMR